MQLGLVVPCYNEEAVIPETASRLTSLLDRLKAQNKISSESSIYFVDDGSTDGTWRIVEELCRGNDSISGIKLSRNRGHQNAALAGLLAARGDALITIDADLQDDIEVIAEMVDAHADGYGVVYGVRRRRDVDTPFKRVTAHGYYRLLGLLGVDTVYDHADYRLMSRAAVESLREFREVNLFLRGIVPLIGFRSTSVYYDRTARLAGESKYPLRKMLSFALEGITSFSARPLRLITVLGFTISFFTILLSLWAISVRIFNAEAVPGWASTVLPVYFLGGIQLLSIGVIGEYLAKIYIEVKDRPRYIIEKII
jgi:glycosyltransferase involved in cell wall biosynthesis